MRTDALLLRVECYVAVRKALGYAVRSEEKLLKDFVQFLELNGASSPIRAQTAIEWACAPAPGRGPSGEASRLKVVRCFLSHLQAFEFETEVPGPGVLPAFQRPLPYLYSSDEIAALMKEASHLGPKDSLRPYTYVALIGLLASSGLRVGEALHLLLVRNVGDVGRDAQSLRQACHLAQTLGLGHATADTSHIAMAQPSPTN